MSNPTPVPWESEISFLRHLSADPALNAAQSAMLQHCAKRIESTALIQTLQHPSLSQRLRIAAKTLIKEKIVYAEDVEVLHEAIAAIAKARGGA